MSNEITASVRATLAPHYAARAAARVQLQKATEALEIGQRIEQEATQELTAARNVEESAMNAHASKLERAIVAGMQAMPPALVIDTRARQAAETRVTIARKALQTLTEQHSRAVLAAQRAEAAVAAATDAILGSEAEAHAAEIQSLHADLVRLGTRLRGYLPSGGVSMGYAPPPTIAAALALVPVPDGIHVPVNLLRAGGQPADFAAIAARRAALIAGEGAEAAASDAAAA